MIRPVTIALTLAALALTTAGSSQTSTTIQGRYRTDDGNAIITVAPCAAGSAALCGRLTRFLRPEVAGDGLDSNNPDASLRRRQLVGISILSNLTRDGSAYTGRGYSPEEGRNFNATVTPHGNQLRVRGCVAIFCRTVEWTKVS